MTKHTIARKKTSELHKLFGADSTATDEEQEWATDELDKRETAFEVGVMELDSPGYGFTEDGPYAM